MSYYIVEASNAVHARKLDDIKVYRLELNLRNKVE